jgi:hypothetical protein
MLFVIVLSKFGNTMPHGRFFVMQIRNRIKELRQVRAGDLRPNPKNWRTHPIEQQNALRGLLAEIGFADALLARELDDGSLELIDGHLRAETTPHETVPVLVLDVNEQEADQLLATLDPLAGMATANKNTLNELLGNVEFKSDAVTAMLGDILGGPASGVDGKDKSVAELEISPELFERQDYLVVYFDNEWDWNVLCERLGVKTVANAIIDRSSTIKQKGLGRVVSAKVLLRELGYG